MELHFSFFPIIFIFTVIFFFSMMLRIRNRAKSSLRLPPGPRRLPILGNLHQMVGSHPHKALRNLSNKHGPLMYLEIGEVPTVIVSSAEYAKEVMKTHDIIFASRPKLDAAKVLTYNYTDIGFAPYGEYWRQLRKICVLELLSAKRVRLLQPIREQEASKFISWVRSNEGSPINLTEKIFKSTFTTVSRMVFREIANNIDEFISYANESSRLSAGFNIKDTFPSLKLFHFITGASSELEKVHKKGSKLLGDIINQHMKGNAKRRTNLKEEDGNLLDVLLKFHERDGEFTLTMENIKAIIMDIFGAGGDTSSSTVDWTMIELIKHPRVMEKAQVEVRRVLDGKTSVDEDGVSELKYLKLVVKETLRLHPPGPLLLPRENSVRCEINGYEIPEKARLIVNAWAIQRDTKYWGVDAEIFYPERFVDNTYDFKVENFEYIPFGAGRRMCPGMTFGLTNAEFILSQLLYHFDWKLPDGFKPQDLDMTDDFGVSMRRRDDLHLIPTPYDPPSTL